MIDECYMETCCRWDKTKLKLSQHQLYFSDKFFTKRDLVVEEMEETTIKLEKVNFIQSSL